MAGQPDPTCAACSKPIQSGRFVVFQHGELFHVACRSRTLELTAFEEVDRAKAARRRAVQVIENAKRRQAARRAARDPVANLPKSGPCPLCGHSATLTNWHFVSNWIAIEGCPCGGFFIGAPLLEGRLSRLTAEDRADLSRRIRTVRVQGHEAWVTTKDGTVTGALVIWTERPDRPP